MIIKILEDCRWAIPNEPWQPQIIFKKGETKDVVEALGKRMVEVKDATVGKAKDLKTPLKDKEFKDGIKDKDLLSEELGDGTPKLVEEDLYKMNKKELIELAAAREIEVVSNAKRDELIEVLSEQLFGGEKNDEK